MEGTPNMSQWKEHQTWHNGGNTNHGLPFDNRHKYYYHYPHHHHHQRPHSHFPCIGRGRVSNSRICLCGCVYVCGHCTCEGDAYMYKYVQGWSNKVMIKINTCTYMWSHRLMHFSCSHPQVLHYQPPQSSCR